MRWEDIEFKFYDGQEYFIPPMRVSKSNKAGKRNERFVAACGENCEIDLKSMLKEWYHLRMQRESDPNVFMRMEKKYNKQAYDTERVRRAWNSMARKIHFFKNKSERPLGAHSGRNTLLTKTFPFTTAAARKSFFKWSEDSKMDTYYRSDLLELSPDGVAVK